MKVLFLNPQQEMGGIQCLSAFLKQHGHQTALVNDPNLFENPFRYFFEGNHGGYPFSQIMISLHVFFGD